MSIGTSIGHYGALLRRWLWLLVLAVVCCTAVTYILNVIAHPIYETSALIQVHDTSTNNGSIFVDQALAQSDALLITRPDVLQAAANRLHEVSAQQLADQVSDSPLDNTPIIQVRVTDKDPVRASLIANTIVDVFIQAQNNLALQQVKNVSIRLAKNVRDAKKTVDNDQQQLSILQASQATAESISHQNDVINGDQITYNSLLTNYTQLQQQLLQIPTGLKVVQSANVPSSPSSPHTLLNTVVAGALSLVLSLVFILLLDWSNTTIKTAEDVEQLAELPALGSVPYIRMAEQKMRNELPIINNDVIEQAFGTISTNLIMKCAEKHTVLVTSIQARAGNSTTAVNLAITLAHTGLRVMLIDGNLQRGSLHRIFKHPNIYGLTTVMTENMLFQEGPNNKIQSWLHQHQTSIPNLWFLPTGPLPAVKGNILRAPILSLLINCLVQPTQDLEGQASSLIDIIIIDAAPLTEDSNTTTLASCADAALLIVEAGREQARQLQKWAHMLRRLHAPLQGVIVNRRRPQHMPYIYVSPQKYKHDWLEQDEHGDRKKRYVTAPWARIAINNQRLLLSERPITSNRHKSQPQILLDPPARDMGQLLPATYSTQQPGQYKG
ncbi:P-loop NTPase [Dictyobacter kobayashii]|uniref:Polysaccharide chain length determinant N-terminal domain-containing protein n=1 Tax=Dictyobacter kobayashii TaxID=2014872 RepID=A0A402AWF0_9CHLR|nr:P-loop NTPase [Dictyobacter kobayashii]GCE23426.1 hypothetical protein KDK_72260 [Dictyobacter kobayashii]